MRRDKKLRVIDLFAGAGGFGLGFHLAGTNFKIDCSLEIDKWAVQTLRANRTDKQKIIHKNIRKFRTKKDILSACSTRPDIIIGGPPCQGFSRVVTNKDPKDPRNSLFKNFAQWVHVLQPKVFVMENVRGLLSGKNEKGEKIIDIIETTFTKIGYTITIWELNAANYGVPQSRERIFIVGNKYGVKIDKPAITHYLPKERKRLKEKIKFLKQAINVINAIGDLPKLKAGEGEEESFIKSKPKNDYQRNSRAKNNVLYNHVAMVHTSRVVERYKQILNGLTLDELPNQLKVRQRNGNGKISNSEYNLNYRHLQPDMIAYTIPASFYSNFIHPYQPRNITSREAARLQSFPDSYIFKGKRTQISSALLKKQGKEGENHLSQYNQIGNAVPPLLAKAIAKKLYRFIQRMEKLNKKYKSKNLKHLSK